MATLTFDWMVIEYQVVLDLVASKHAVAPEVVFLQLRQYYVN